VTASGAERPRRAPRLPRNTEITIGGVTVPAGRRQTLELPVARLPTDTSLSLPVAVVNGLRPGPTVWLSAAVHGDEVNGVEIIRQVLRLLKARSLSGTVIAVPVVNVFGFVNESRYLPDRRDLNRMFPGSPTGSLTSRLAHLFLTEVVSRCDYGIDFHTGSDHRTNLAQLRVDLGNEETRRIAEAFAAPVTVDAQYRDGSLRAACSERGIPLLVFEGGEAHRFNEAAIHAGVHGTLRVLDELGMRPGADAEAVRPTLVVSHTKWVRARRSGIARIDVFPGQVVERGEALGEIADALGESVVKVRAAFSGVVLGYTRNPLVSQGDALVHIADTSGERRGGPARPPS
jgi:predicted deacylase